jgi:hypothetical protein
MSHWKQNFSTVTWARLATCKPGRLGTRRDDAYHACAAVDEQYSSRAANRERRKPGGCRISVGRELKGDVTTRR